MQRRDDGGLGSQLVGDKITVNHRTVQVTKLLGEGGFSYVYLVKEIGDSSEKGSTASSSQETPSKSNGKDSTSSTGTGGKNTLVLKITSIHSRQQRSIAEKEAKLLSRLSHPSIIKMYDSAYRSVPTPGGLVANIVGSGKEDGNPSANSKERPQHLILMEYCEGGHALDVCSKLSAAGQQFDLSSLIIAFGQICNAVSYLHAQRPPIVHRDLKPVNFLVKNGAYKLCDFGSAVFGHVELKTPQDRSQAEEVIQKTTTQMFRAPEMVDLHMAKKLTQSTDVWALGCCLYSLAYLQNCFEEGSNLAILSRNYKIPQNNPYGDGLVELIDRMLTEDPKARADMTEVILCLSAIYSGKPLPKKKTPKSTKKTGDISNETEAESENPERVGTYRTDGQGIRKAKPVEPKKPAEAKKLNPNSAAARRRRAAQSGGDAPREQTAGSFSPTSGDAPFKNSFGETFDKAQLKSDAPDINEDLAFSTTSNPFAGVKEGQPKTDASNDVILGNFAKKEGGDNIHFDGSAVWSEMNSAFPTFSPDEDSALMAKTANGKSIESLSVTDGDDSKDRRRARRPGSGKHK